MSFGSNAQYTRALSDTEVSRWVMKWNDNGLWSWDILKYVLLLVVVAIPFIFTYWLAVKVLTSSKYRTYIRSGENGMPVIGFGFAWFIATAIINDIFFAILFRGPVWAAYYDYAGAGSAIDFENTAALFRATGILFGAWS
ncbi:MAG: hypothetical protein K0U41_08810 [Gammaproteobacteria bacterium]|nr:hypothetical protein [Gammaproteobacteria bacterium]